MLPPVSFRVGGLDPSLTQKCLQIWVSCTANCMEHGQ